MQRFVVGIDEAGRGPLAGPVAVGLVAAREGFDVRRAFPNVNDSKQLCPDTREEIYREVEHRAAIGEIHFCVRFSSARYIDAHGINRAIERAIQNGLRRLPVSHTHTRVLLDGLLHAPRHYEQETIVRGDALVPIISLASVVAKVRRDRLMRRLALEHPHYGFDQHKGYGTPAHYGAIGEWGLCHIHRKSYLQNVESEV